jgi:ribosomal protein S18 acetylase RimI-like enzyme
MHGAWVSFLIRVAEASEYAEAGRVTAEAYRIDDLLQRADGLIDTAYEAELTDAGRRAREAELLVAVEDGNVLGTVTWCPPTSPWRELATEQDQAEFRMLSVAAAGRRRGVGRALVTACLERARAERMREVLLSSLPQMTSAHALYREFGFVRTPELDHSPKPHVHLWAFRLTLDLQVTTDESGHEQHATRRAACGR